MIQALFETLFDILYLAGVITAGVLMLRKGKNRPLAKKFGFMAVLLGLGDAFHLVPRIYALWTTGLEANAALLGFGKLITSITMTIFYLILYYIWQECYNLQNRKKTDYFIWLLTVLRISLCLLPGNKWLQYQQPLFYGILRNLPFALMGLSIIWLFYQTTRAKPDDAFKQMPLAILLSFAFYIPVVLFSAAIPLIGMLMIPKTLAYVWIVAMGWKQVQK